MARRKRGLLVVLAGPDGTGKSTTAEHLVAELERKGAAVSRQHYRPNHVFARSSDAALTTTPHAVTPRRPLAQVAKIAATAVDTWLGLRRARRQSDVVLIERGWWDQVIDPTRYRLLGSERWVRRFGRLLPRVDVLLHLTGDAEAIAVRKPELSVAELRRQDTAWTVVASEAAHEALRISTTVPLSETNRVLDFVARALTEPLWRVRPLRPGPRRLQLAASHPDRATLSAYVPQTRRAAGALWIARRLFPATGRERICVAGAVAAGLAGLEATTVMRMHGSSPGRHVIALGNAGSGHVVKLNDRCDAGLSNEITVLASLRNGTAVAEAPSVQSSGEVAGISFLTTKQIHMPPRAPRVSARDIAGICTRLQLASPPLVHGDLAPWNIRSADGGWLLIDWESAERRAAPTYDACFFVVSCGALLQWWGPSEAARVLTQQMHPIISEQLGLDRSVVTEHMLADLTQLSALDAPRGLFASACREELSCAS